MGKLDKKAAKQASKQTPKEENKKENKTPKTPGKAPETPQVKPTKKPEVEEPEVLTEERVKVMAATNPDRLRQKMHTLSPDATIQALSLLDKSVVNTPDPALAFPLEVRKKANLIVAIGTITTLMDHCAAGDDSFALAMQKTEYAGLIECAKAAGYDIKLPDIKALPVIEDGRVQIAAKEVKISKTQMEQAKKEAEIRKQVPELDPEKITSEEDLKKALEYKFLQKSYKLVDTLTDGIDFMKRFRLHEASLAENADDAKKKFEARNSGDWLDDLFSYIKPGIFFAGIGKGMASVTAVEKNVIHAFTIFRDAVRDKNTGEPVLDDQELAYCVKSIVKWVCNTCIESNNKAIEGLDSKKNAKDIEACNKQIEYYTSILGYINAPDTEEIDTLLERIGSKFNEGGVLTQECQDANKLFNIITKSYYGKELSTADYTNLANNIQQYGYHIINLFRNADERRKDVGIMNISELEERSEEEKAALIAEAKKAWAEKKKETSKNA